MFMLQLGDFIYLHKLNENKKRYRCKVEGLDGKHISVTYPVELSTSKTEFFVDGTSFLCEFTTQIQQAFEFQTTVVGRVRDQLPLLILENPGKEGLRKIQRREFLRVESSLDVAIQPLHNDFEPFTSVSVDISAGGTAVLIQQTHNIEQVKEVIAWLSLPMLSGDIAYLKVLCKVVRFIEGDAYAKPRVSLQFVDLDDKQQQIITKYCFEQQVSSRKKGITN
jgi:c-di-GMP-binding flagellar brake protein YcgR